jgi:hypothetical protein
MGALDLTEHRHTERGTEHRFNFPLLIAGLESRFLLNKGECRIGVNGFLIHFEEPVAVKDDEKEEMMGLKQPTAEEMEVNRKMPTKEQLDAKKKKEMNRK